jgi:hypothetical protein
MCGALRDYRDCSGQAFLDATALDAFDSQDVGLRICLQTRRAAHRKCAVFGRDRDVPYKNPGANQIGDGALYGEAPFLLVTFLWALAKKSDSRASAKALLQTYR